MTSRHFFRRGRRALLGLSLLAGIAAAPPAFAWTDKPVRIVIPAPPGGTMDVLARVIAEQLTEQMKVSIVVDNRPGAGGAIGVSALLGAAPDGQTIMVTASNVLAEIPLVLKTPFDPLKDLAPVADIARANVVMVAHPGVPAQSLAEVIAYAKANAGKLSYASYSAGTAAHYAGLILNQKAGIDLLHVPYKGSPPALTDVMAGQVPLMFDGMVTSLPLIRSGKIKVFAVAGRARSALLPNTPTFTELGFPDLDFGNWIGVVAAARLTPELIGRIHAEMAKAAATSKVRERLVQLGFDPSPPITPAQLAQSVRTDYERNAAIVKAFAIKFD